MIAMPAATALPSDIVWPPRERDAAQPRPSLLQCLLLAGLLHALLVALVGTAPGLGLQIGEPSWGAIRIRLGGSSGPGESGWAERPPPALVVPGRAPEARYGGAAPQARPRPAPEPGAAEIGERLPRPTPEPTPLAPPPARAMPETRSTAARPPTLAAPAAVAVPAPVPSTVPEPLPLPAAPEPPPRPASPTAAPSTAPRLAATPTVEAPALRRPQEASPDIAAPLPQAGTASALLTTALRPETVSPGPLAVPPSATPLTPSPPVPPAKPPARAAQVLPAPAPSLAPVDAQTLPAAVLAPAASPSLGGGSVLSGLPGAGVDTAAPSGARSAKGVAPTLPPPDPRPRLNLELPPTRPPAPDLAAPRLLNLMPPPPARRPSLAEGIEQAARPDCRQAYRGAGVLAVIPLVVDALRDRGCSW